MKIKDYFAASLNTGIEFLQSQVLKKGFSLIDVSTVLELSLVTGSSQIILIKIIILNEGGTNLIFTILVYADTNDSTPLTEIHDSRINKANKFESPNEDAANLVSRGSVSTVALLC